MSTSDHHTSHLAKSLGALTLDGHRRVDELLAFPAAIPAAVGVAALALAVVFLFSRRTGRALAMTALGTISIGATLSVSLYPRVMVSSTDFSLTADDAASSHYALQVMSVVALIFVPLVLLYQGWTCYVVCQRLGGEREPV